MGSAEPLSIDGLFQAVAERLPDRIAVAHNGRTLTYGELDRYAGRLAAWLLQRRSTADTPVRSMIAFCLAPGLERVAMT